MTTEQFNEKYKTFIENGFDGLEFENHIIVAYLDKLFVDFIKIPEFKFNQIKIKFGSARFYSNLGAALGYLVEDKINEFLKSEKI